MCFFGVGGENHISETYGAKWMKSWDYRYLVLVYCIDNYILMIIVGNFDFDLIAWFGKKI